MNNFCMFCSFSLATASNSTNSCVKEKLLSKERGHSFNVLGEARSLAKLANLTSGLKARVVQLIFLLIFMELHNKL